MTTELKTSAAYRIAFAYAAAFALAVLLLGATVYFAADAEFRSERDQSIIKEASEIAHDADDPVELRREIAERTRLGVRDGFTYALFDRAGRRIAGTLAIERPAPAMRTIELVDPNEGPDEARAQTIDLPRGERLVVALDSEWIEDIEGTFLLLFAGAFIGVLVVGGAGALLLGRYLSTRLDRIGSTARGIVEGDLTRRVPVSARADEFDQVAVAVNAMLDRIGQLMENLHQVSSDIAHDLRTPLLRLRNQLELVGKVDGAREMALRQGDALLDLFASILRIAEVERGSLAATFVPLDLSGLVRDVCESYQPAIADGGRTLQCAVEPGLTVSGNRELLAQALGNLLDNAQRHTPAGSAITVSLASADRLADLCVGDDGPGVATDQRQRMLLRFVRGEASRSTPGAGLGLSLVAAVARAHGGEIVLEDNHPGLRVRVLLPVGLAAGDQGAVTPAARSSFSAASNIAR